MNSLEPDISIIILTFNAKAFLRECLTSIHAQQGLRIETIVVDNHSTDDTIAMIEKEFPLVTLVVRDTHEGFAAGNNAGVAYAHSNLILFLNPDTKLLHSTDLKQCVDKYKTTNTIGVLTCRINLALTGRLDETCHRGFPTPWAAFTYFSNLARIFPHTKLFGGYLQSYKDYNTEHEIDAAGGMFMLLSKQVGAQAGWWDEAYPLYGEDLDFCYRIKACGFKILYWPAVTVLHYKGISTGMSKESHDIATASKTTTKQVKGWSIQAMELFYKKHYQKKYPAFVNWLVSVGISLLKLKRMVLT